LTVVFQVHLLNAPVFITNIVNLFRPFLKERLFSKVMQLSLVSLVSAVQYPPGQKQVAYGISVLSVWPGACFRALAVARCASL
jgi:hypothetical protein